MILADKQFEHGPFDLVLDSFLMVNDRNLFRILLQEVYASFIFFRTKGARKIHNLLRMGESV